MADTMGPTGQVIEPTSLYTLSEVMARTGLRKTALRQARRRGLPVHYHGRTAFILGKDLIGFLIRNSRKEH